MRIISRGEAEKYGTTLLKHPQPRTGTGLSSCTLFDFRSIEVWRGDCIFTPCMNITTQDLSQRTVREIALAAPQSTRIFEQYKIDYCCGGRRPLAEACERAGVDVEEVYRSLSEAFDAPIPDEAAEKLPLSQLVDHILAKHHVFAAAELERLTPLMDKVVKKHGEMHPELYQLQTAFGDLKASLLPHMQKEERVLFPYIQKLYATHPPQGAVPEANFGTVQNPIRMMMTEHDSDGELLALMNRLTNGYTPPEGACPSFAALYYGLTELERDLHRHIHLENNVLFPAAAELEWSGKFESA